MAHTFVRVPPDSTGKRIHHHKFMDGSDEVYQPYVSISDVDNPDYGMKVDARGQAYFRFAEGAQQFDAYGNNKTTSQHSLADYVAFYDDLSNMFWDNAVGTGASLTKDPNRNAVIFTVGTANGEKMIRTSHKYHKLIPGNGQLIHMSFSSGDLGKAGVVREWGYFDDTDGGFFRLDGNQLSICLRSSITGTPIDLCIPQSQWSEDTLDGTGISRFNLDISKTNLYWIGIQANVGKIRFGVFDQSGQRIVCHIHCTLNSTTGGNFQNVTLPIRVSLYNKTESASISQCRLGPTQVFTEGTREPWGESFAAVPPTSMTVVNDGDSVQTILWAMKLNTLYKNKPNRTNVTPIMLSAEVRNISGTLSAVILSVYKCTTPNMPEATWSIPVHENSGVVGDIVGIGGSTLTEVPPQAKLVATILAPPGLSQNISLGKFFDYRGESLKLYADGIDSEVYILTARHVDPTATSKVFASLTWWEVR